MDAEPQLFGGRVHSIVVSDLANQIRLQLRTQDTILDVTVDSKTVSNMAWEKFRSLALESIVQVTGVLHLPDAATIHATGISVIANANLDSTSTSFLLRRDEHSSLSLNDRLNNRILDVRMAAAGALFKLHSGLCQLIVEFLGSHDFHWIHTPRIITATIPGDREYFHLPYFGQNAWLAQSSQHHKQMAMSMDMQRIFEIGPVFRAETKSRSSARHLTEFTVLDIAMAIQEDYHEVIEMVESMILFAFQGLRERQPYQQLIAAVHRHYPCGRPFQVGFGANGKIPRITFLEAKRILREELGLCVDTTTTLSTEEERALGEHFRSSPQLGQTDIFTIEQYPTSMRQFNSKPNPDNSGLSNTWDTIVRGREICSGSQRIHDYKELCRAMRAGVCGPPIDPDDETWSSYLNAFQTGMPPHGGCGLGVNRLLQSFLGLEDVREVTMFPRDVNRLSP